MKGNLTFKFLLLSSNPTLKTTHSSLYVARSIGFSERLSLAVCLLAQGLATCRNRVTTARRVNKTACASEAGVRCMGCVNHVHIRQFLWCVLIVSVYADRHQ